MSSLIGWTVIPRIGFGGIGVSPHGVGIALGVLVGAWVMSRRARRAGFDENHAWNGAAWGVVGAIIGARVAYVAGHFELYWRGDVVQAIGDILRVWQGGISLVGGLIGAFTLVLVYTRRQKISFFQLVDFGAPGLGIGIAVGRIGDLIIGDHLGKQTSGWWGWEYRGGELISPPPCLTAANEKVYSSIDGCIRAGTVVHQTALYDMIWSLAIFGILLLLGRSVRRRGFMWLSWAALYSIGRIASDFLRVDKTWFGSGLTGSQITSLLMLAVCIYLLVRYRGIPMSVEDQEPAPATVGVLRSEPLAPEPPMGTPSVSDTEKVPTGTPDMPGHEPWTPPPDPSELLSAARNPDPEASGDPNSEDRGEETPQ